MMGRLDRTVQPTPAPIRPFVFPPVRRRTLNNGLEVLSARHGRLPVVTARVVIDAGAAYEDPLEAGLAYLTANALDTGTEAYDAEALAWELERLGVELNALASWDALEVEVTAPVARLEPALALLAEVVREACFPETEVRRLRAEQLAEILQRAKEPRALANDMALRFIFGPDVLYGRPLVGTAPRVRELTRDDIVSFHEARFRPAAAAVLLVGDIDDAQARELARRHFGDWRVADAPAPPAGSPPVAQRRGTTMFVVDRPDAVQSEIRVGHVGVARGHEDYFPLLVMNTLLGGAFTSRLNLSLRERHGFTYHVSSGFGFRRAPGPFIVQTAVATDVTARAVEEILRELDLIREKGATDEEVDNARHYLSGVLPLELQTTEQLAAKLADLAIFDLPDDYFERYTERVAAVMPSDVARVAREHLLTDDLSIVVAGNAAAVAEPLRALGRGPVLESQAPEPASATASDIGRAG